MLLLKFLINYKSSPLWTAFAFFICFAAAHSINAATYTVTTIADSGAGSLRQAVLDTNATAAGDTIVFASPLFDTAQTIDLTSAQLSITNPVNITGRGARLLTVRRAIGNPTNFRIFEIAGAFTVSISGIIISNGSGGGNGFGGGGVLNNGGTLTLNHVAVSGNHTIGVGGGINNNNGTTTILNSTVSANTAGNFGGGILVAAGTVNIANSTVSGNSAPGNGGSGGIDVSAGTLNLNNVTITDNRTTSSSTFNTGGVRNNGTANTRNSIIAGNLALGGGRPDVRGTFTSNGNNLIGDTTGNTSFTQPTDKTNVAANLDVLANNGGQTDTHRLSSDSPAIDAGDDCVVTATCGAVNNPPAALRLDQRGVVRPYDIFTTANATGGSGADIGAFELIPTSQLGWGFNNLGQVGDGTTTTRTLPTQIAGGFTDIVSVEGGSNHALGLRSNGTLLAWGRNDSGQLGDGTTTQRSTPGQVSGLTNVVAMVGGGNHSLALLADGTVWAWGSNINGQLGNQLGTFNSLPAVVSGITNAVAVAAANNTSYALLANGSVVAWGRNSSGQLGDGTTTPRSTPGQVSGLTSGVISIDGGGGNCYAVLSDGSVRAWGTNNNGQVGDGTIINRLTPVTPLNLTSGVVQVAGGFFHAAALKSDGTLLTWGANAEGQLGDGTMTNKSTPTAISLANVTQIKSNLGSGTYARLRDGSLYAWGANFNGEVGNGTTATAQTTPVRVSTDAGIGFFGAYGNGGYAGSPLAPVAAGANQFVRLGDATVNFPNVATAGTLQIRTFDPSLLTSPAGYTIEANSNGYDITSTAQFIGNAQVCLKTPNVISLATFNMLTILHDDNFDGILDAVTVTRNYQRREVCRVTRSFSPFVLAQALVPLAANVTVDGRVTADGRGLRNAVVQLTNAQGNTRTARTGSFGYYRFDEVEAGQTYTIAVHSKRFQFAPQVVSVSDNITDLNFTAIP